MKPNQPSHRLLELCGVVTLVTLLSERTLLSFDPNEWRQTQMLNVPKSGLARINLPAATLDTAKSGLQDLRIIDPTGTQVPYLIERPAPEAESMLQPKEFRSTIEPGATRLLLKTGATTPIAGVTLETPATRLVKGVDVEGSNDGTHWKKLATGEPIFQFPDGVTKRRVSFAEGAWEFLRLTVDDRRSEPVPFTGAQLHKASATAPVESIPIQIKSLTIVLA